MRAILPILLALAVPLLADGQRMILPAGSPPRPVGAFHIGRAKYAGGGDWYNDPQEEVNLLRFAHAQLGIDVDATFDAVDLGGDKLFTVPFLYLTGHGNIVLTENEVKHLRTYLENGGFLYIDDDYGLDKFIRREMKRVLPELEFRELPFDHPLYHFPFEFPSGPPKIMEHDGKAPQGFAMFLKGRLAVYYTYESNPSDGWNDFEVHNVPEEKRQEALRFGTNLIYYALTH